MTDILKGTKLISAQCARDLKK